MQTAARRQFLNPAACCILVLGMLPLLAGCVVNILRQPNGFLSASRLAWAYSVATGYAAYYPPGEGPVLPWMYGPFAFLVYLPVTCFNSPTWAVAGGSMISAALFFLP